MLLGFEGAQIGSSAESVGKGWEKYRALPLKVGKMVFTRNYQITKTRDNAYQDFTE